MLNLTLIEVLSSVYEYKILVFAIQITAYIILNTVIDLGCVCSQSFSCCDMLHMIQIGCAFSELFFSIPYYNVKEYNNNNSTSA